MKKTEIEQERARLAGEVFEGAPDWCTHAYKNWMGLWYWFGHVLPTPNTDTGVWRCADCGRGAECKNQPETSLHWTDTLLRRGDYE